MLILTRRPGESFYVGDNIKVTLTGVKAGTARLGFEAPKNIEIHREEIYERIHKRVNELTEHEEQAEPE